MAEDQDSHFDDPEEQEPIKVSVTFKPQGPDTEVQLIDNSDDQALDKKSPAGDPHQTDVTCYESETEEPRLPANPHVTPIPSYLAAEKATSDGQNVDQPEVLEVNNLTIAFDVM